MTRVEQIQPMLAEMVRRLVAEYQPERIILFGSYAWGEPNEDSDIDLFVVKQTEDRIIQRMAEARRILRRENRKVSLDVIVFTPGELNERLEIGDHFVEDIVNRGRLLYAA
jgi:predicted nucleotidyltransferase